MGRDPNGRPIQILFVGRAEPSYEKFLQSFQQEGCAVHFARTQTMGLQLARQFQPNIVVINTVNSHFSGDRLCRILARRLPGAQRVLIVERGEGAQIPCEQRLVRPFTGHKLRETLRKMLESTLPHTLQLGEVELNLTARVVSGAQGREHLTPKECKLLSAFMRRPNQVISRQELMNEIWDTHYLGDTRTLDVHIRWLREKIEVDPHNPTVLVTQRGVGYKLIMPGAELPPDPLQPSELED